MIMDNKINIAELLKDCPKGMELDCPLFENLEFERINKDDKVYPIICRVKTEWGSYNFYSFNIYGCYSTEKYSKCVIFPKGKTTWEGFVPPCKFKDGDIVVCGESRIDEYVSIFKTDKAIGTFYYHAMLTLYTIKPLFKTENWALSVNIRLATEKEKEKLFDAIKANGYKWNEETKTLEKLVELKFKVGNRVQNKNTNMIGTITLIDNVERDYQVALENGGITYILFEFQDSWELVPNKFDITTLKPFDKVLVRDHNAQEWVASLFSNYNEPKKYKYICVNGSGYAQCIPYEGNEHLCGTTDNCDEFYKNWE